MGVTRILGGSGSKSFSDCACALSKLHVTSPTFVDHTTQPDNVDVLLSYDADVHALNEDRFTALHIGTTSSSRISVAILLLIPTVGSNIY